MFNLGLVSISFRNYTSKEILSAMKQANLSVIEWGSDVHAPYNDSEKLNEIVTLQNEYGIICSSYGTYFRVGTNKPEEIVDYINAAKMLGTDILRIWCGNKGYSDYSEAEAKELIAECEKLNDIAKEYGVILCSEYHPNTFCDCVDGVNKILNSNIKTYWQPNQYKSFEDNIYESDAVAENTVNIHVFNWKEKEKFPLCEGEKFWIKYLNNFNGKQNLLLEFMPDDKIESLKTEADAIKKIVGEL